MKIQPPCSPETRRRLFSFPHKLLQASLGFAGTTPELLKERLPRQLNDLLIESENLFNRCVERGEIIVEKRRRGK